MFFPQIAAEKKQLRRGYFPADCRRKEADYAEVIFPQITQKKGADYAEVIFLQIVAEKRRR